MEPFLLDLATKELPELQEGPVVHLLNTAQALGSPRLGRNKLHHIRTVLEEILLILSEMSTSGRNGSYPVTRRIVLGMVLSAHSSLTAPQAKTVAEVVDNIHFEFYRLHRYIQTVLLAPVAP
jgi:hypothetical protein